MAEGKQINITAPPALAEKLEELCPEGVALSTFARQILEGALKLEELPALTPKHRIAQVDWTPVLAAIEASRSHADEAQDEVLRAVHEHGEWSRMAMPINEVRKQAAKDQAARNVSDWKRSVGRDDV